MGTDVLADTLRSNASEHGSNKDAALYELIVSFLRHRDAHSYLPLTDRL